MMKAMMLQFATVALAVGTLAGCAEDSGTETAGEPATAVASTGGRNCVESADHEESCYATFTEAVAVATGGAIKDAPIDARLAVDDPLFTERLNSLAEQAKSKPSASAQLTALSTVIVGIAWDDANYGGDTYISYYSSGCDGNPATYDTGVVGLGSMNDRISSFRSYSGCQSVYFEDVWFHGAATNGGAPITDMRWVGKAMNDQASSVAFY